MSEVRGKILAFLTEIYKSSSGTNTANTYPFDVSSGSSRITVKLNPPIPLDKNGFYKMEILRLSFIANLKNITNLNNKLRFTPNGGAPQTLTIPEGQYDLTDLFSYIANKTTGLDNSKPNDCLLFILNDNTMKVNINIPSGWMIDNTIVDSILPKRFGMTLAGYVGPLNVISDRTPSISEVDSVSVCCDIVNKNTIHQSRNMSISHRTNILWSVPYGSLDIGRVNTQEKIADLYFPLIEGLASIQEMNFWLEDQDGNKIVEDCELSVYGRICQIKIGSA